MPLFQCNRCRCVENTAVGSYWGCDEKLCSECATGNWHGRFEKRAAKGMLVDQNGHLWRSTENLPAHYRIIGRVGANGEQIPL